MENSKPEPLPTAESELIEKLKFGDSNALCRCIDEYSDYLCALCRKLAGAALSDEDIEELVSDSFVSLWYSRDKLKNQGLRSYIAAICRNKTLDRLRALKIALPLNDDICIRECNEPETELLTAELTEYTRFAVESLPEPDREIFKRHYFLYEKTEEIAVQLGINPSTVRGKLSRGREKLRAYLEEKGFEYENTNF